MTCELSMLKTLWAAREATFGVASELGFPDDFIPVPFVEDSLKTDTALELLNPNTSSIYTDHRDKKVAGLRSSSASFKMQLHSHGLALNGAVAAPSDTTWAQLMLLKTMFGGVSSRANGGATTVASSSTTTVTVTAGRGVDFAAGQAIACRIESAPSTKVEARTIASIAGDVITVEDAFSVAPVVGTPVCGSVTLYLTENPAESLALFTEGAELEDKRVLAGMNGTPKLAFSMGKIPELQIDLKGATWNDPDDIGVAFDASPTPQTSFANFNPVGENFSELLFGTTGSSARVAVDHDKFTCDLGISYAPVRAGGGVQTVARMRRQRNVATGGSFVWLFDDHRFRDALVNRTDHRVFRQIGNVAGSTIALSFRQVQVAKAPEDKYPENLVGVGVTFEARPPAGATTELARSVVLLHLL